MKLLELMLPASCCLCGALGRALCHRCQDQLPRAAPGNVSHAPLRYDGSAREVIAAFKFRGHRLLAPILAELMIEQLRAAEIPAAEIPAAEIPAALVTWAPTSRQRARARGYDQAELLARAVARQLSLPVMATLQRQTTTAQTGRPRHARLIGPRYEPLPRLGARTFPMVHGRDVLVVDDVATTGASLAAATLALDRLGVGNIVWSTAAIRDADARAG